MIGVKQSAEGELTREAEVPGENLRHYHFVYHKSHLK
jgi:hypothetical protein